MHITVLGAGAWGTALAAALAPRHPVTLWAREAAAAASIAATRRNERYLPGIELPPALGCTGELSAAVAHARHGLLLVATPTAALRDLLRQLRAAASLPPVVWLCKGLERGSAAMAHEVVRDELGNHPAGPLAGPSFAQEVARGLPTALAVAGHDSFCRRVTEALHGPALRIYSTRDVVGVEVGGAVKNVLAIATGICDALALGHNARAALITRGLAETSRLGLALGAAAQTFMGLTGAGDLILTCTGELSRNRQVGLMLGRGTRLPEALERLGHVAEGVWSAPAVQQRAAALGVRMPITEAVCAVLDGRTSPRRALEGLLARQPGREGPE
ncbi:MAG: NAD(P)-dependent glycerol-3-phosphate dehydrogenase [Burkholderiaceae bacterium]|nr:NAD(P)-dependent glycerol-3-phosphate dehydrogenase [Burkholderiaceae bacterium]